MASDGFSFLRQIYPEQKTTCLECRRRRTACTFKPGIRSKCNDCSTFSWPCSDPQSEGVTKDEAEVDIVAVHGLNPLGSQGHAYNTWSQKVSETVVEKIYVNGVHKNVETIVENDKLWLKDFLPFHQGMPKLRVLLFGYNSSAAFRASTLGFSGAATNLLDQLRFKRLGCECRPIVFVAHSLGGLVVKQALVEAHNADDIHGPLLQATRGVAFFATPHRGGHGAKLGDVFVRVVQAITGDVRNDIMEALRKDSFLTGQLDKNFARRAKNLRVVNFMENLCITDLPVAKHFGLVVPQSSSALNWAEPEEVQVLMEASHTTICKFRSKNDELYTRVADHMLELISWASQPAMLVPTISASHGDDGLTSFVSNDHAEQAPPPLYTSGGASRPITPLKRSSRGRLRVNSDVDSKSDSDDNDNLPAGWMDRIRAASPFMFRTPVRAEKFHKISVEKAKCKESDPKLIWPIIMIPYQQNFSYVDRAEVWSQIVSAMHQSSPIILHGIGGSGKTQTAIYLSYWFQGKNPDASVMWINATSVETCLTGLRLIAARCGIRESEDDEQLATLRSRLERSESGHWLMIFDAADDLAAFDAVTDYVPLCRNGQVLFTSCRNLTANKSSAPNLVIELGKLDPYEAARMVHSSLHHNLLHNIDSTDMDRLVRKLDYLPLAIAQAVGYMNKHSVSIGFYLTKISNDVMLSDQLAMNEISENGVSGVSPAVYSTWKTSFERLARDTPGAAEILGFCSFLEAKAIPITLIQSSSPTIAEADAAVDILKNYAFVEVDREGNTLDLHHLIQVATQRWLRENKWTATSRIHTLTTISANFPDAGQPSSWPLCQLWMPHALKVLESTPNIGHDVSSIGRLQTTTTELGVTPAAVYNIAQVARLKTKIGFYYHQIGQYVPAREYLENAVDVSRLSLGTMDEITTDAQEKLIFTLRYLGRLNRAHTNAKDLKRARKAKLGRKHRDTLKSYSIYAFTLMDLGKWKDCLSATQKALNGYRDLHNNDSTHLDILHCCRQMASCYRALGQYASAEKLLNEALLAYKQRNEEEHPDATRCIYTLAILQGEMGNFTKSEANAQECYRIYKKTLSEDHPDTLKVYYFIGYALQGQKKWEDAENIYRSLLENAAAFPGIGKEHMYSYKLRYTQGMLQEQRSEEDETMLGAGAGQDRLWKARAIFGEVLSGRTTLLGAEHLETLVVKARLAAVNARLGRFEEAESSAEQVLRLITSKEYKRHGVASALILWICQSSLQRCAYSRAQKAMALPGMEKQMHAQRKLACSYAKRAFDGTQKTLGTEHPESRRAAKEYLEVLEWIGDEKSAVRVREKLSFGVQ